MRPRRRRTPGRPPATADPSSAGSVLERLIAGPGKAALALPRMAVTGKVREGRVVSDEAAAEMLSVIAALPRSLQRSLTAVQHADGQLTLRFAGGPVTTWGDAERTLAKTVALRTVLREYADAGKTVHPAGRLHPGQDASPSRSSSDGGGSSQPVVEPGRLDGPSAGLFDTPQGRG